MPGKNIFSSKYDKNFAYNMFLLYLEDRSLLGNVLRSIAPLIGFVVYSRSSSLDPLSAEFLCTDIFNKLFDAISRKAELFDVGTENKWNNYLHCAIKNMFMNVIRSNTNPEIPSGIFELEQFSIFNVAPFTAIDNFIAGQQRDALTLSILPEEVRFCDKEHAACMYIAEIMLGRRKGKFTDIAPKFVDHKRVNFFVKYTQLLIANVREHVESFDAV